MANQLTVSRELEDDLAVRHAIGQLQATRRNELARAGGLAAGGFWLVQIAAGGGLGAMSVPLGLMVALALFFASASRPLESNASSGGGGQRRQRRMRIRGEDTRPRGARARAAKRRGVRRA